MWYVYGNDTLTKTIWNRVESSYFHHGTVSTCHLLESLEYMKLRISLRLLTVDWIWYLPNKLARWQVQLVPVQQIQLLLSGVKQNIRSLTYFSFSVRTQTCSFQRVQPVLRWQRRRARAVLMPHCQCLLLLWRLCPTHLLAACCTVVFNSMQCLSFKLKVHTWEAGNQLNYQPKDTKRWTSWQKPQLVW